MAFEGEVKATFELLGYQVERDSMLAGSQVDLVATLPGPLFNQVLLVECKDLAAPVGIDDVRTAHAVRDSAQARYPGAWSLIVSRAGFTKTAKEAADKLNVRLLSLAEIKARLFDPSAVIEGLKQDYEGGELAHSYVEMSCQVTEHGNSTIYKPVETFIDRFVEDSVKPGLAILGNFGSGKTSLCAHYAYELAQRWTQIDARKILPVLIQMRDLRDLFNLDGAVLESLRRTAGGQVTESGVRSWLHGGTSLLILDGLDEMASGMTRNEVAENLAALARYVTSTGTKFLITCRTHFFKSFVEEDALGDVLKLYVREWGRDELVRYVQRIAPAADEALLETIRNTYNLQELAKTPIFLKMIVDTSSEVKGRVNPAKLYKAYTDRWIEDQAHRSSIPPEDKLSLMQEIASHMDRQGVGSISHQEIPTIIREFFDISTYETTRKFDADVRSCSFLIRNDEGVYRFSHKSFAEFFVASKLAGQIKTREQSAFSDKPYSKEICGFVANYFESESDVIIKMLIGSPSIDARRNACSVLANLAHHPLVESALILALDTEDATAAQDALCEALATVGTDRCVVAMLSYFQRDVAGRNRCFKNLKKVTSHPSVRAYVGSLLGHRDAPTDEMILDVACSSPREFETEISSWIARSFAKSRDFVVPQLEFAREVRAYTAAMTLEPLLTHETADPEVETLRREVVRKLVGDFRAQIDHELADMVRAGVDDTRSDFAKRSAYERAIRQKFGFLSNPDHLSSALDKRLPTTVQRRARMKSRRNQQGA